MELTILLTETTILLTEATMLLIETTSLPYRNDNFAGLVAVDPTTGNILEDVSTEEAEQLGTMFEAASRKVVAKDEAVLQIGTVNRAITCVVAGSISARDKVLSAVKISVRGVD